MLPRVKHYKIIMHYISRQKQRCWMNWFVRTWEVVHGTSFSSHFSCWHFFFRSGLVLFLLFGLDYSVDGKLAFCILALKIRWGFNLIAYLFSYSCHFLWLVLAVTPIVEFRGKEGPNRMRSKAEDNTPLWQTTEVPFNRSTKNESFEKWCKGCG